MNQYRRNTYAMFMLGMIIALFVTSLIAAYRTQAIETRLNVTEQILGVEHVED